MAVVIRMPEVLTGAREAALQSWLVSVGDAVTVGQPLAEVETEKATVEYEAEAAGTVAGLLIDTGVQVSVGTPIAVLAADGESVEDALASADVGPVEATPVDAAPVEAAPVEAVRAEAAPVETAGAATVKAAETAPVQTAPGGTSSLDSAPNDPGRGSRIFMSPLVRRLAAERGLDLSGVAGSGPGGRIVRRDLDGLSSAPAASTSTGSGDTGYDLVPHTSMRRAIARRLTESKSTIPHFYLVADIRVDALLEFRASVNERLPVKASLNDLIVKAVAAAFAEVPDANVSWTDEGTRRFHDVDVAVAVAIEGGLVTPVVRGVNRKSLAELGESIRDLVERGRTGRLKQTELEGGSFAVSNLGMYGTEEFSAIINPPQSGILAVGAARKAPVVVDDSLEVGTVMTVTLSADHRALDGALAAQWLSAFVRIVENPISILL